MAKKLKNLTIEEISFVTKGASGDGKHAARVVFRKGKKLMPTMVERLRGAFSKQEGEDESAAEAPAPPRTKELMLQEIMEALPDDGMRDKLMLLLEALSQADPAPAPEPAPKAMDEDDIEKVAKADPELAANIQKLVNASKAQADELAELRKSHGEEIAKRRRDEIKKQVAHYTWLPGDHDEVAELLEQAQDSLTEKAQETLASLFRSTDGIVKKAQDGKLFREKGSALPSDNSDSSARLAALAKQHMTEHKVDEATARAAVLRENRELRDTISKEAHPRVTLGR